MDVIVQLIYECTTLAPPRLLYAGWHVQTLEQLLAIHVQNREGFRGRRGGAECEDSFL